MELELWQRDQVLFLGLNVEPISPQWDIDMKSLLLCLLLALPSTLMNSSLRSISTVFNVITLEILVTWNGLFLLHTGAERVQWSCVLPVHLGSPDSGSSERRCAEYCSVSYSTTRCTLQEHPVWSYSLGGSALQSPKLLESHQMPCSWWSGTVPLSLGQPLMFV